MLEEMVVEEGMPVDGEDTPADGGFVESGRRES